MSHDPIATIEDTLRRERPRLVAALTRLLGADRLALAEDVVQDACLKALETWRERGVPDRPEAWLIAVARNRALDRLRRDGRFAALEPRVVDWIEDLARPESLVLQHRLHGALSEEEIALLFLCCHPALSEEVQVALTLKTQCGLSVDEIARAFLAEPDTIAQRIVRAKAKLREIDSTFDLPAGIHLATRLRTVLRVIYLMFNEGYAATGGDHLIRHDICSEALRLVEALAARPETASPETHALTALLSFQHARAAARQDAVGDMVLLQDQDRTTWNYELIERGFSHLRHAMKAETPTQLHLEAGIASVHAMAPSYQETDWRALCDYYESLAMIAPSPIVELNRAVALSMVEGPTAGLAVLEPLKSDPKLSRYALYHAVIGDLAQRNGDLATAQTAFARALELPCSRPERRFIESKIARLQGTGA